MSIVHQNNSNSNTIMFNYPTQQAGHIVCDTPRQDNLKQDDKVNMRIQVKDSSSDTVSSPLLNQYQQVQQSQQQQHHQIIGAIQNLNINPATQQVYQNLERFKNFQENQNLQTPPYSEDPKNPQNYLFVSSLPGSKYGSQTQISNSQSQNQLSSHNLQAFSSNQSHQHPTINHVNNHQGLTSSGKINSKQQISQPELKSYKQVKAIHRGSKLLTPTSAFSPEIQKVIEDMKQKQLIQTNDSSDFALGCLVASNSKNEGMLNSTSSNYNNDQIKDSIDKRRLSALEVYQLKSHQIVQDLNSIQQQVRIDSANVAIKRNTISTLNNIILSQNGSLASLKDQQLHKLIASPKNQSNIQSLTSLDKQNHSTEANRLQKSKYQQYGRNGITINRFNQDRDRLKEALLEKQENPNKNNNASLNHKMQTISLPDISYGLHSFSEIGSDKKPTNTRQVKTRGSLEHLDDLEEANKDYVIQNSNRNTNSNQSSPRRRRLEASLQDYLSDSKSDSPLPQIKINKIDKVEIPQVKHINMQNNIFQKRSLDCVSEVLQDQDSKILPSPQFAQQQSQNENQQGQHLSSVETFSSSEYSNATPKLKEDSSLNMIKNYFPITNKIEESQGSKAKRKEQHEDKQEKKEDHLKNQDNNKNISQLNQQQIISQKDDNRINPNEQDHKEQSQQRFQKSSQVQQKQHLMHTPDSKQTKEQNQQIKEKSLQSSIVSLKNNEKLANGIQNSQKPITISDIQPLDSERKINEIHYNMLLKQQNQQQNIHQYSPIQLDNLQNQEKHEQSQPEQFQLQNQNTNQQSKQYVSGQKIKKASQNSSNLEQISQKLLQNQMKQKYKNERTIAQQGLNSFGSEVDLQVFLQDIQHKQEEEKRLQLQNQLIEARLDLDTNYKSILNSINPSPRMAPVNQQGYFSNHTQFNTKSFGDLLGSEIFTISDLNQYSNYQGNQRRSSKGLQNTNNLQEKINTRIQKQMVQKPSQMSPKAVTLKKEVMRAIYYQKDIQYKGDGKFKSPKRISVKSRDGQDVEEIEYTEEDLHITNILSDNYVESINDPSNSNQGQQQKQNKQQQQQAQTFNFNQPSYLRATKSFQQNVLSQKSTKERKPSQLKFKFK